MCSRVTTTDGRSPGSRVVAFSRLPRPEGPVACGEGSPLTVAGAATALRNILAPYSLLISRRRTVAITVISFGTGCQPASAAQAVRASALLKMATMFKHAQANDAQLIAAVVQYV
jgi:hypothetical protein